MTAQEAVDTAHELGQEWRLRGFSAVCGPRGACQHEALAADPGRWTWCPDCLTVYDDYGAAVNVISAFATTH